MQHLVTFYNKLKKSENYQPQKIYKPLYLKEK